MHFCAQTNTQLASNITYQTICRHVMLRMGPSCIHFIVASIGEVRGGSVMYFPLETMMLSANHLAYRISDLKLL